LSIDAGLILTPADTNRYDGVKNAITFRPFSKRAVSDRYIYGAEWNARHTMGHNPDIT
jgi:hypothetical protein